MGERDEHRSVGDLRLGASRLGYDPTIPECPSEITASGHFVEEQEMNWEAFTGLATAFTGLVILVTVFVGLRQVRHLQQATQLEGMLKLLDDLHAPALLASIEFVRFKLPEQLKDESYRGELASMHAQQEHPVFVVLRWLEKLGTLARYGLIDPKPLYAMNSPDYQHIWAILRPIVRARPAYTAMLPFDNAEYLCTNAWRWLRETFGSETYDRLAQRYGWDESTMTVESR